ncbi:MAG: hypothetical protein J7K82_00950 [Thermoproteales archaeon]|nr:hypothetical protein [Thermoproteales archaeon]
MRIIGFGNIGSRIGEILFKGFQSEIIVLDPYVNEDEEKNIGAKLVDLDTLLSECEVILISLRNKHR